ncbi:MAG: hypothetical protein ABFE08_05000 [Armatimonadia bacterium]
MALAPLDIANQALALLKCSRLSVMPTASTGTPQSQAIYDQYERAVKVAMARLDPTALRHTATLAYSTATLALSSGAVAAGVTCTASAATWLDGCKGQAILEVDEDGADLTGVSAITGYTSNTVLTIENTTAWDDATPAADRWRLVPPSVSDFTHEYLLPSDCLMVRHLDDENADWSPASQRRLWTTYGGALLTYTRYDEDPDNWPVELQQAAVYAVAAAAGAQILGLSDKATLAAMELAEAALGTADGGNRVEQQRRTPISASVLRDCR